MDLKSLKIAATEQLPLPLGAAVRPLPEKNGIAAMESATGLIIRQKVNRGEILAQACGVPYEARNQYDIKVIPPGKKVKSENEDEAGWEPSAEEIEMIDNIITTKEESDCCIRTFFTMCKCRGKRPLQLHLAVSGVDGSAYIIDKPFRFGAMHCCGMSNFEMFIDSMGGPGGQPQRLGRTHENFSPFFRRCWQLGCEQTNYIDIDRLLPDGRFETRYILRINRSCCGRTNNFCAPSCCKNDAVFDILDKDEKFVVAHIQQTYAARKSGSSCMSCIGATGRSAFDVDTYLLEFPKDSTADDRVLLLASMFQLDYTLFERDDDRNNHHHHS